MCNTDVYRIYRAGKDESEKEKKKVDIKLVCASTSILAAVVSPAK
jgi:hypothetical protein